MSDTLHILIKLKDQDAYFDSEPYPHYEIGWKKGNRFYGWNRKEYDQNEIETWEEI